MNALTDAEWKSLQNKLYTCAVGLTQDPHQAMDFTQYALMKVWENIDKVEDHNLSTARQIGRYAIAHVHRNTGRKNGHAVFVELDESDLVEEGAPEVELLAAERANEVAAKVGKLADLDSEQYNVFRLCWLRGHSLSCVSDMLDIPRGTAASRLARAIAFLGLDSRYGKRRNFDRPEPQVGQTRADHPWYQPPGEADAEDPVDWYLGEYRRVENYNGTSEFYLLRLVVDGEILWKYGITSQYAEKRYEMEITDQIDSWEVVERRSMPMRYCRAAEKMLRKLIPLEYRYTGEKFFRYTGVTEVLTRDPRELVDFSKLIGELK